MLRSLSGARHYAEAFHSLLKRALRPSLKSLWPPHFTDERLTESDKTPCLCLIQGSCKSLPQPCPVLILLVTSLRGRTKHQLWKTIYFGIRVDLPKKTCSLRVTDLESLTPGPGSCKKKLATGV